ncbi:hypothetical protein C3L33_08411, partial [Rhododendron williamsianum]
MSVTSCGFQLLSVDKVSQIHVAMRTYENDAKVNLVIVKVFLINGIVMGGGAGLSMNGMFRIVTENTCEVSSLARVLAVSEEGLAEVCA